MKKVIKLTESKLNAIVEKILREQEAMASEPQVGTTGPAPEDIAGSPEDESGEPDFGSFLDAAKELMGQGMTIGDLVDKLLEVEEEPEGPEGPEEPESAEPEPDQSIPSDNQ